MATITVRDLDDDLRVLLRQRAAQNDRSMEAEVREILRVALTRPSVEHLGTRIRDRFRPAGGVDLELPQRTETPRAVDLR